MNRQGHVAVGVSSAATLLTVMSPTSPLVMGCCLLGAALGSLLPDLDHKTGTLSNLIQFSSEKRKWLSRIGAMLLVIGGFGYLYQEAIWAMTALVAGGIVYTLSRMRNVVLISIALLLFYNFTTGGHWLHLIFAALFGLLPFVKHRGLIHTPELAALLTLLYILFPASTPWLSATLLGGIIGWWSHLVGDALGKEGITSLFLSKANVALRVLNNGGTGERWLARGCWTLTVLFCSTYVLNIIGLS